MREVSVWGWRMLILSIIITSLVGLPSLEENINSWKASDVSEDSQNNDATSPFQFESEGNSEVSTNGSNNGEEEQPVDSTANETDDAEGGNTSQADESDSPPADSSDSDAQSGSEDGAVSADDDGATDSSEASSSDEPEQASLTSDASENSALPQSRESSDLPDGAMSGGWVVPATQIVILSLAAVFAIGAIGSLVGAAIVSEGVRMGLILAVIGPIVGLMVKNENGTFTRGRVLGYIEAHPGIHFSALRDALGLANGVTAHHLYALEKEGKVISWADARRRRYATSGIDPKRLKNLESPITGMQQAIMQVLVESDKMGLTGVELREALQTSRQLMSYHLNSLSEKELIKVEGKGRSKRWKLQSSGKASLLASRHL